MLVEKLRLAMLFSEATAMACGPVLICFNVRKGEAGDTQYVTRTYWPQFLLAAIGVWFSVCGVYNVVRLLSNAEVSPGAVSHFHLPDPVACTNDSTQRC